MTGDVLSAVHDPYAKVPDAACAFDDRGALNRSCPRVRTDVCRAAGELEQTYKEARMPDRVGRLHDDAARDYGCR
jgi:hypothetical protein